jgi:hypothetical protein
MSEICELKDVLYSLYTLDFYNDGIRITELNKYKHSKGGSMEYP